MQNNLKNNGARQFGESLFRDLNMNRLKPSCSLPILLLLLVVIFIILVLTIFWGRGHLVARPNLSPSRSFTLPWRSAGEQEIKPVDSKITIYDADLAVLINLSDESFPLNGAKAGIKPEGIKISGRAGKSWLSVRLETTVKPQVENGKIALPLSEFSAAGVRAPESAVKVVNEPLKRYLEVGQKSLNQYGPIKEIKLSDGNMELFLE